MKKGIQHKRARKSSPSRVSRRSSPGVQLRELLLVSLGGLSMYLIVAFFTPWGGEAGKALCAALQQGFGLTSYLVILFPLMVIVFAQDPARKPTWLHLGYLGSWLVSISLFFDLMNVGGSSATLARPLVDLFGKGGTLVLAWTFLALTTLLMLNVSMKNLFAKINAWIVSPALSVLGIAWGTLTTGFAIASRWGRGIGFFFRKIFTRPVKPKQELADPPDSPSLLVCGEEPQGKEELSAQGLADAMTGIEMEPLPEMPENGEATIGIDPETNPEKGEEARPVATIPPPVKRTKGYKLPPLKLLDEAEPRKEKEARIEPSDYSRLLEETLRSFGIEATVIHVERGPSVTRYELQPAKGVKVSKIVALSDDLALALAATSLRIEAPIPGKSAIGIEIPNSSVAMVYFRDLLATPLYRESPLKTILALGKDITGKPIFTELRRMPHLLIAGATGSGKTVCINTLIASILYKASPLEVQFVMIDPKRVELTIYDGIPHLIQEVVTDPKQAAKVLVDVLAIMDERYNLFKEARVRNLEEYNRSHPDTPLPYIVVLIDELADLMMLAAAAVESSIARLTALARAAGIHLIVATQRPSVDVITGIIKANIPSRVAFAVSSIADSRTILDTGGAEKLLGRGDMLFAPIDAMKPVRLQGAYVSLNEIEALVSFWSQQPAPQNLVQFPEIHDEEEEQELEEDGDELYGEAKEIILRTGQASVSTLQRKLKIGYARAGRLMDLMERRGIVGPADGAKPRKILIPNPFKAS